MTLPGDQTYRPEDEKPERPKRRWDGSPREEFGDDLDAAVDGLCERAEWAARNRDALDAWDRQFAVEIDNLELAIHHLKGMIDRRKIDKARVELDYDGAADAHGAWFLRFRREYPELSPGGRKGIKLPGLYVNIRENKPKDEMVATQGQLLASIRAADLPWEAFGERVTKTVTKAIRAAAKGFLKYVEGRWVWSIRDTDGVVTEVPAVFHEESTKESEMVGFSSDRSVMHRTEPELTHTVRVKREKKSDGDE